MPPHMLDRAIRIPPITSTLMEGKSCVLRNLFSAFYKYFVWFTSCHGVTKNGNTSAFAWSNVCVVAN